MAGTQKYGRPDYQLGDGAHHACGKEFPTCNGDFLPFGTARLVDIHLTHRVFMYLASIVVLWLAVAIIRSRPSANLVRIAWAAIGLLLAQLLVGALNVWLEEYEVLIVLHLTIATLIWGVLVALWLELRKVPEPSVERARRAEPGRGGRLMEAAASAAVRTGFRTVLADYLDMTKPKVQSLLLFTTVTTMYVAGDPSLGLVFLTCLGGALSAGGAGAINHYLDRDIDAIDEAHRRPAGAVGPRVAARGADLRHHAGRGGRSCCSPRRSTCSPRRSRSRACSATCSSTRCGSSAPRRRTS